MKLRELLAASGIASTANDRVLDSEVKGLSTNSLACQPGDLFIGMPGTRVDGGEFWSGAIAAGAIAAIVSPSAASKALNNSEAASNPYIIPAENISQACAQLAAAFYQHPAQTLKLVGVTGTNGKTTTTHLVEFFLNHAQKSPALLGTLYTRWKGYQHTAAHTTPFAVELQKQLADAVEAGCDYGVMEVSSHALAQSRVQGCTFEVSVFTNLTQDHLDYHANMEEYFAAKALLFNPDYLTGLAVINLDDAYGKRLIQAVPQAKTWSYSTQDSSADLWTSDLIYGAASVSGVLHTPKGNTQFVSPLVGQFNLENLLAAIGAVLHLGLDLDAIAAALPHFSGVPGRMEQVQLSPEQDISVIVDYAHTPDSLESMLKAARPFISGQMICVFGCGGDRDRTKRPQMGRIAADLADAVYVTSDNPRTEDPQRILEDVVAGISGAVPIVMGDRAAAIRAAILHAQPGDGVLIAGKGHEDYQILGTEKIHFDDREQAKVALTERMELGVRS